MKTTVEIPNELFRQLKAQAALDQVRMRDILTEGIRLALDARKQPQKMQKADFPLVRTKRTKSRLSAVEMSAAINRALAEEDAANAL